MKAAFNHECSMKALACMRVNFVVVIFVTLLIAYPILGHSHEKVYKQHYGSFLHQSNLIRRLKDSPVASNCSLGFNSTTCFTSGTGIIKPANLYCPHLSKEKLTEIAVNNTLLITTADKLLWNHFGPSWVNSVELSSITYWIVVAMDPETSIAIASLNKGHCFNSPLKRTLPLPGSTEFRWGSQHWSQRTWDKVTVVQHIYKMGFHVIHSDIDATWFTDPFPFFHRYVAEPPAILVSGDMTITLNPPNVTDIELNSHQFYGINTGIYFLRQAAVGHSLLRAWAAVAKKDPHIGHDQDGFNSLVRGEAARGDLKYGRARRLDNSPYFGAAFNNSVMIGLLPPSSFANTYTFCNAQMHRRLNHTLFAVHWVWGGSTVESKIQNIRDTGRYLDPPNYYRPGNVLSFDLHLLPMPSTYNNITDYNTEALVQFHVRAINYQLEQAYSAAAIAMALNRTLILPKFQCYCSKNWYMTFACRVNEANNGDFPYDCPLSQLIRVQKILSGVRIEGWPYNAPTDGTKPLASHETGTFYSRTLSVRERSFLDNIRTPKEYKEDMVIVNVSAAVIEKMRVLGLIARDDEETPLNLLPNAIPAPSSFPPPATEKKLNNTPASLDTSIVSSSSSATPSPSFPPPLTSEPSTRTLALGHSRRRMMGHGDGIKNAKKALKSSHTENNSREIEIWDNQNNESNNRNNIGCSNLDYSISEVGNDNAGENPRISHYNKNKKKNRELNSQLVKGDIDIATLKSRELILEARKIITTAMNITTYDSIISPEVVNAAIPLTINNNATKLYGARGNTVDIYASKKKTNLKKNKSRIVAKLKKVNVVKIPLDLVTNYFKNGKRSMAAIKLNRNRKMQASQPPLMSNDFLEVTNASLVMLKLAPLNDIKIIEALHPLAMRHRIHLQWTRAMFSGFQESSLERNFDANIQTISSYWCCRSPEAMKLLNITENLEQFSIVPRLMPFLAENLQSRVKDSL